MTKEISLLQKLVCMLLTCGGVWAGSIQAQSSAVPASWQSLTVQVVGSSGKNNTRPLRGAKITVKLREPRRAGQLKRKYPSLQLPVTMIAQTGSARFNKLPPSSEVGPYVVTVIPKPNDITRAFICEEKTNGATRDIRLGSTGPQTLRFNFVCRQAGASSPFRKAVVSGYDLTVKIEESAGTHGVGLWVRCFDKTGKLIKKVRTGSMATAVFRDVDPADAPYRIEVHKLNKRVYSGRYDMPNRHSTYVVDLNVMDRSAGVTPTYELTVKLDLWLRVYDKQGRQVKKTRLGFGGKVVLPDIDPSLGPYRIEVYSGNKLLYSTHYDMPRKHAVFVIGK